MKLYATTTSERASKGQGGSKQVEILLQVDAEKRVQVGRVVMKSHKDNTYTIEYYPICGASFRATKDKNVVVLLDTTRGKKKKDHKCDTVNCQNRVLYFDTICNDCIPF